MKLRNNQSHIIIGNLSSHSTAICFKEAISYTINHENITIQITLSQILNSALCQNIFIKNQTSKAISHTIRMLQSFVTSIFNVYQTKDKIKNITEVIKNTFIILAIL